MSTFSKESDFEAAVIHELLTDTEMQQVMEHDYPALHPAQAQWFHQ